jgi:CheY-like chemotaxis protein
MQPVDVADVVTRALATLQPAIDAKKIAIKVESEPGLPIVNGDPDRLEQVIRNLLSNAVKFVSRRGSVRVEVKPSVFGVAIDVTDDGQGIDPTFLPHMFERFRQGDSRAAREHGGLGLGLAIVKELVELHGGIVSASSPGLGCGATFRIDLPVTQDGTQSTAKQKPQASRASAPQLAGLRVLIVDDDTDALELLRTVLETAGATVVEASSGVRALSRLRRKTVDVVLTDIGMPGMDGYELIRRIRNLPSASSGVPAAAVTGYARSQDRVTVLERGFQAHIAKPFVQSEVVSVVSELASFDKRRVM